MSSMIPILIIWLSCFAYWALVSSTMLIPRLMAGLALSIPFALLFGGFCLLIGLLATRSAQFRDRLMLGSSLVLAVACIVAGILKAQPQSRVEKLIPVLAKHTQILSVSGRSFLEPLWAISIRASREHVSTLAATNNWKFVGKKNGPEERFLFLFSEMTMGPQLSLGEVEEFRGRSKGLNLWAYYSDQSETLAVVLSR